MVRIRARPEMTRSRQATKQAAKIERLQALTTQPNQQAKYAAQLLAKERDRAAIQAAIVVLAAGDNPGLRPLLLRRYEDCDRDGVRRDPGGVIRIALLEALRPLARPDDVALLERAATTYEFLYGEATGDLRAAALLTLNEVDDALAGFHSVRLLTDEYTSMMSGEPALTAARVLASQGQVLPLYAYVSREQDGIADVLAESFRSLTAIPASLLPPLVERYGKSDDEIVLLGLFDLLLAHDARADFVGFVFDFLRATALHNIYRYLISALIAGRDEAAIAELSAMARAEREPRKREILEAALALR